MEATVSDGVVIRCATDGDVAELIEFLTRPDIDGAFEPPLSQRAVGIRERALLKITRGFWMLACIGVKIVGCRGCNGPSDDDPSAVEFSTLVVDPAYRGRGIGFELMQAAVRLATEMYRPRAMRYDSTANNSVIEALSGRLGFEKSEPFEDPKRPHGIRSVIYERMVA